MEASLFLHHPCNIFICGPSGSGKTQFVKQLIKYKKDIFDIVPERIVWCYKEWQSIYGDLQESENDSINFIDGIPDDDKDIIPDTSLPSLIIFDDMLGDVDEEKIKLWFTRKGHHRNASIIYITQNMFQQSRTARTISLNSHYMVLFQNSRDKGQIKVLANQVQLPHLLQAYQDATTQAHGYLLLDFHPKTPEQFRIRTDIFHHWQTGDDRGAIIYTH